MISDAADVAPLIILLIVEETRDLAQEAAAV